MADQDAQDRNLPASARKLSKAREQGQIARSRDLGHFAAIAVGGAVLVAAAPAASGWLKQSLARALQSPPLPGLLRTVGEQAPQRREENLAACEQGYQQVDRQLAGVAP